MLRQENGIEYVVHEKRIAKLKENVYGGFFFFLEMLVGDS
jgi:hypothetical protein